MYKLGQRGALRSWIRGRCGGRQNLSGARGYGLEWRRNRGYHVSTVREFPNQNMWEGCERIEVAIAPAHGDSRCPADSRCGLLGGYRSVGSEQRAQRSPLRKREVPQPLNDNRVTYHRETPKHKVLWSLTGSTTRCSVYPVPLKSGE